MRTRRLTTPVMVVAGFIAAFVATFLYFWTNTGGGLPGQPEPYRVAFETDNVGNLIDRGDVSMAGVKIGTAGIENTDGKRARVVLDLNADVAPLHEGATVRIGVKSLIGTSYVDVVDGHGAPLASGATLPGSAVKPAIGVDQLIETLDPDTRASLSGTVQSLGSATAGTSAEIAMLADGLGKLGREGHTALDAIAAQSDDLQSLARQTTILLNALDTGQGRIADVVGDANRLTQATSGQRGAIEDTVRALPGLLQSAEVATQDVQRLSGSLAPVASDLRQAAPQLNSALLRLPAVSGDLRGLLPGLDRTLDTAPATLQRVPGFGADVRNLIPHAQLLLQDVNPMLAYLRPYGTDLGSFFANWGAAMDITLPNGVRPMRLSMIYNQNTLAGKPLSLDLNPLNWTNPYPAAGAATDPSRFDGEYPKIARGPK